MDRPRLGGRFNGELHARSGPCTSTSGQPPDSRRRYEIQIGQAMICAAKTVIDNDLDQSITKFLAGDSAVTQDPYPLYKRIRDAGPVYWYRDSIPIIARFADATALFKDSARFLTYRGKERFAPERLSDEDRARVDEIVAFEALQMNEMNGDGHRRVRAAAQRAFLPPRINQFEAQVRGIVNDLLDEMAENDISDFMKFAYRLPLSVVSVFMGMPKADIDTLKELGDDIAAIKPFVGGELSVEKIRKAHLSVQRTQSYVREMVARHRSDAAVRTEFMEALLDAQSGDKLSQDELGGTISILIYASHESSTNMLGNGLHSLLTNRDQWERLVADPSLSDRAVAELLRYNAPVQMMTRRTCETATLSGVDIPEQTRVLILYGSANHDEREFADPDSLDLMRTKANHISFGYGVHVCIGSALARLEGRVAFETLTRRFPDMEIAANPGDLTWNAHPVFRGLKSLPVRLGRDRGRTDMVR
ncbi:MAG: cytochrome P450 [Mesorhizobium sp.]|nr:cytochrome P450 [Mesorhizobium sp.]